jgi:hypothetical protein
MRHGTCSSNGKLLLLPLINLDIAELESLDLVFVFPLFHKLDIATMPMAPFLGNGEVR